MTLSVETSSLLGTCGVPGYDVSTTAFSLMTFHMSVECFQPASRVQTPQLRRQVVCDLLCCWTVVDC